MSGEQGPSGFQRRHGNWLAISGPVLGVGGCGVVGLVVVTVSATNFKPSALYWATLVACSICVAIGLYITLAVFADWPLPEPGPKTRRVVRLGALLALAAVSVAVLWFLHGALFQYVTVSETITTATFVIAALTILLASSTERLARDISAQSREWKRVEWSPSDYPGRTILSVPNEHPVQTFEIAPGNFQEISWAGITMRLTYTAQYRSSADESAVQLRIEATRGFMNEKVPVHGGPLVDELGQALYRLPEGSSDNIGARCVYGHLFSDSFAAFALYVDHVNPQNGLLRLKGLFATSPPIDWAAVLGNLGKT